MSERRARVVRFVSEGTSELMDAIESGMLTADAKKICEKVADENKRLMRTADRLRRENEILKDLLNVEKRINQEHTKAQLAGYSAVEQSRKDEKRTGNILLTIFAVVFASGAITAMFMALWAALR